jgi:hypothetical protein
VSAPRLKASIEAHALLRLALHHGRFATLRRRGDVDGGSLLLLLRTHQGEAMVLQRVYHETGEAAWLASAPAPLSEEEAEQRLAREIGRDPDLWVIEIEGPDFSLPFLGRILQ